MTKRNQSSEPTPAEMLAELQAENAALRASLANRKALRVSESTSGKGGVSVYGLNAQFPVTLYAEQWERLLEFGPQILAFIKAHPKLPRKVPTAQSRPVAGSR